MLVVFRMKRCVLTQVDVFFCGRVPHESVTLRVAVSDTGQSLLLQ